MKYIKGTISKKKPWFIKMRNLDLNLCFQIILPGHSGY